jgi:hypothetical protein
VLSSSGRYENPPAAGNDSMSGFFTGTSSTLHSDPRRIDFMKVKMILPALTEARSPLFRPIKYSLFPPLGLATLAAYLPEDADITLQDEHVERLNRPERHEMRASGKTDPVRWLRMLDASQKQAGVRLGKYRFKRDPRAPDPDACAISLTGGHIPATLQRALDWSMERHGRRTVAGQDVNP